MVFSTPIASFLACDTGNSIFSASVSAMIFQFCGLFLRVLFARISLYFFMLLIYELAPQPPSTLTLSAKQIIELLFPGSAYLLANFVNVRSSGLY